MLVREILGEEEERLQTNGFLEECLTIAEQRDGDVTFTLACNFPFQLMYEISYLICDPRNIIIGSSFELSLYLTKCCWLCIMCNEAVFCQQFASRN